MQEPNRIEETVDSIKDYVNTQYELTVLKGADKVSRFSSGFLSVIPITFFIMLIITLLSFGLALYLNTLFGNLFSGFLIVSAIYGLVVVILLAVRKNLLVKPIRDLIVRELFKNNNL